MRAERLVPAVLALIVAAYAIELPGPYQFDDLATVAVDPGAASLEAWWSNVATHVRPLTKGSFALTSLAAPLLGSAPLAHRLGNLAIHLATVAMLFVLGRRIASLCFPALSPPDGSRAALLAAALFGLHPFATEAVSYISGRSMALGTLLAAFSLDARLRGGGSLRSPWLAVSLAAFAAAVLARESVAASVPLLVLVLEAARDGTDEPAFGARRLRRAALGALPFFAVTGAAAAWMLLHARYSWLLDVSRTIAAAHAGDASLLPALGYFAESVFVLRFPNIDPAVDAANIGVATRIAGLVGLVAIAGLAWRVRQSRPQWIVGLCWALAWLVPMYAFPIRNDPVSERHFYPALWGIALALAVELVSRVRADCRTAFAAPAACAVALCCLFAVTVSRNADYRSEVALWESTLRRSPDKPRVLNNLGVAYMEAGRWEPAVAVLARAEALEPYDSGIRWNLRAARAKDLAVLRLPAFVDWERKP